MGKEMNRKGRMAWYSRADIRRKTRLELWGWKVRRLFLAKLVIDVNGFGHTLIRLVSRFRSSLVGIACSHCAILWKMEARGRDWKITTGKTQSILTVIRCHTIHAQPPSPVPPPPSRGDMRSHPKIDLCGIVIGLDQSLRALRIQAATLLGCAICL